MDDLLKKIEDEPSEPGIASAAVVARFRETETIKNELLDQLEQLGHLAERLEVSYQRHFPERKDYLSKPINIVLLDARVGSCLQRRQAEKHHLQCPLIVTQHTRKLLLDKLLSTYEEMADVPSQLLMSRVLSAMADQSSFSPVWKFGKQVKGSRA